MTTAPSAARQFLDRIGGMSLLEFTKQWPVGNAPWPAYVEDQDQANERIPLLLEFPDTHNVVWAELRGPVDFTPWLESAWSADADPGSPGTSCPAIDWLILSGSPDSPTDLAWLRRVIADCRAAGVPVWVRSIGRDHIYFAYERGTHVAIRANGSDPSEWPSDLRCFETPACFGEGV